VTALLVIPTTGEAVDVKASPMLALARVMQSIADAEKDLRSAKRELADEIAERLDHEGRRSLDVDGWHLEVSAPTEKKWNVDELRGVLAELVGEGTISDLKSRACVRYKPEPVWAELKTLLSDPRCQARIAHCFEEVPTTRYAKVRHA